jgi:hypothetical protein
MNITLIWEKPDSPVNGYQVRYHFPDINFLTKSFP